MPVKCKEPHSSIWVAERKSRQQSLPIFEV
jgi:hypothetical protein